MDPTTTAAVVANTLDIIQQTRNVEKFKTKAEMKNKNKRRAKIK